MAKSCRLLPLLALTALLSPFAQAGGSTYLVTNTNDSGPGSFRWAVGMANDNPHENNVVAFEYTAAMNSTPIVLSEPIVVTGPLSIVGNGMDYTVIDGNELSQILVIADGVWFAVVQDMTLRNARNTTGFGGGAISSGADILTMTRLRLLDNRSDHQGAAIFHNPGANDSRLTISDCEIRGNEVIGTADFNRGGGLHAVMFRPGDRVEISRCSIADNRARRGGGISVEVPTTAFDEGQVTWIEDSDINDNQAEQFGGGIYIDAWSPHLLSITTTGIAGNRANANGGGIWARSSILLSHSLLRANEARNCGGGAFLQIDGMEGVPERWELLNSTVSGNRIPTNISFSCGAGLAFRAQEWATAPEVFDIRHSTIAFNQAESTGLHGAFGLGIDNGTDWPASLSHTIVAANTVASTGQRRDLQGAFEGEWSLLGTLGVGSSLVELDGVQRVSDPGLQPLADNGRRTLTHKLLADSPARNTGNPDFSGPPDLDQRRDPAFPRIASGRVDIGAFESQLDSLFRSGFRDFGLPPEAQVQE